MRQRTLAHLINRNKSAAGPNLVHRTYVERVTRKLVRLSKYSCHTPAWQPYLEMAVEGVAGFVGGIA